MPILTTHNLSIGYRRRKELLKVQEKLNLELYGGEMLCLIGPNGSGKSTLLRTLSALQKPLSGKILLDGRKLADFSQKELAKRISLVLTDRVDIENAKVKEIVALGQHPYSHWIGGMSAEGKKKIEESIEMVHLEEKADELFSQLSDGEQQRVMIAKALAQDTPLIFLDEPTAHLDLPNRVEIMHLLHGLAHKTGKSIIISTHELDLALQAADRIWLMGTQSGVISGVPEDLVLNGTFDKVFSSDAYFFNQTNGNFSMNYQLKHKIAVHSDDKTMLYWTFRALARVGYSVESEADKELVIKEKNWIYREKTYNNIGDLLNALKN